MWFGKCVKYAIHPVVPVGRTVAISGQLKTAARREESDSRLMGGRTSTS